MGCRAACGVLTFLLVACAAEQSPDSPRSDPPSAAAQPVPPDTHTSRDALDWAGIYEGFLPCADCPATFARLILHAGGRFELATRSLVPSGLITHVDGPFAWQPDGNTIALDAAAGGRRFQVGEGRLMVLADDGSRSALPSPLGVLGQRTAPATGSPGDLGADLQNHRWSLRSATDASNRPINALVAAGDPPFVFGFSGNRVRVDGGCNGLLGGYVLDADNRVAFQALAATLMACDPALMAADAALAELLAEPLDIVQARGAAPAMALLTGAGEVLMFAGELTLEARYGPPTTVFLEVAPQRLPCEQSVAGDGLCLQVRELRFDAQGLRVGSPGEFRLFPHLIEGFEHEAGTRAVLRILRFHPSGESGEGIHVLDMVVESDRGSS